MQDVLIGKDTPLEIATVYTARRSCQRISQDLLLTLLRLDSHSCLGAGREIAVVNVLQ